MGRWSGSRKWPTRTCRAKRQIGVDHDKERIDLSLHVFLLWRTFERRAGRAAFVARRARFFCASALMIVAPFAFGSKSMTLERDGINPAIKPSGTGWVEWSTSGG